MISSPPINKHVVNQIVENDLCVRCAACEPACPWDIIRLDDQYFPYIVDEAKCPEGCTRCLKVCPGGEVDFAALDRDMFDRQTDPRSVTGFARSAFVSFALDDDVRYHGASGGLVTQLLTYMLDEGHIDGALVLGVDSKDQAWDAKPFIARTAEELRRAAKSKYTVVPHLLPLAEMESDIDGNYAVVALPCYAHALKKYQKVSPKLRKRLKMVIGLYCNVVFEPYIIDDACEMLGIDRTELADFRFRHGEWPGGVVAQMKDGTDAKVLKLEEMKDEFNLLKLFYAAPRCNLCTDFSAEYSDIAVGDPWLRGPDGKYLFEDGRTAGLVRTDYGAEMLQRAQAAGYINIEPIPLEVWMTNFEFSGRYKRDFVPKNMKLHQMLGKSVPEYGRPISMGPAKGWLPMVIKTSVRSLAKYKWFRKTALAAWQSPPALAFLRWNRKRKERSYSETYPNRVAFVQDILEGYGANGHEPGTNGHEPGTNGSKGKRLPMVSS